MSRVCCRSVTGVLPPQSPPCPRPPSSTHCVCVCVCVCVCNSCMCVCCVCQVFILRAPASTLICTRTTHKLPSPSQSQPQSPLPSPRWSYLQWRGLVLVSSMFLTCVGLMPTKAYKALFYCYTVRVIVREWCGSGTLKSIVDRVPYVDILLSLSLCDLVAVGTHSAGRHGVGLTPVCLLEPQIHNGMRCESSRSG
jgi:hypothetical protein